MKKIPFTLLVCFFTVSTVHATNLFWVGGTGNWNDVNHWATVSGGAIHPATAPGSTDDVFFDANSFSAISQKVSLTVDASCRNMNWTGVTNSPTLEFTATPNRVLQIYGSLVLVNGMNVTYPASSGKWELWSSSTGNTITTAGKQLHNLTFNGDGGGWTLQDNVNADQFLTVNYGSFNSNNVTINTGTFVSVTGCGGCNTRSVTLGSSVINCTTQWNIFGDPALTLNTGTSTIRTPWFRSVANTTYFNAEMNGSGINTVELNGSTVFNNFDFTAGTALNFSGGIGWGSFTATNRLGLNRPASTITFISGSSIVANGLLTLPDPGAGCSAFTTLQTIVSGSPVTITKASGSVVCSRMIIKDIAVTGGASFTANQSIDQGGNSGWTINAPTALTAYWIGGTGNWDDVNHWSASSGGAASGCIPTLLDNVFFDANSFTGAGQKVSLTVDASCHNMNWTGVTNNPTLEFTATPNHVLQIYGSLVLVNGMNVTYPASSCKWEFWSSSTGNTITTAGKQLHNLIFNGDGGGWTLQDNVNADQFLTVNYGSFNSNNVTINTGTFVSVTGCGGCNTRSVNLGSSIINCTTQWNIFGDPALTLNTGTSTIRTPWFRSVGNIAYYNAEMNGSGINYVEFNGSTVFNNFDFTAGTALDFSGGIGWGSFTTTNRLGLNRPASTITFIPGSSIVVNGALQLPDPGPGCSAFTTLRTLISGSPVTITKASGSVVCSRMIIKDIAATGGASFTANQSIDQGGNSGWTINTVALSTAYWIGGTGNWDDVNHWSASSGGAPSGCIPTLLDNVFFDANSFSGAGQKVSLTVDASCHNMNWTGVTNNPTLEFTGTPNRLLKIYGSLALISGMNVTYPASSGKWEFWSSSTGNTITSAGKQLHTLTFNGDGGGWTLQDDLNADQFLTVNYGVFNSNNVTINTGSFNSVTGCGGCNNRTVNLGVSAINCTTQWNIFNDTGLTLNAGSSVINAPLFISGQQVYNNVTLTGSSGSPTLNTTSDIYNKLTLNTTVNTTIIGSGTLTTNAEFTINGPPRIITINPAIQVNLNGAFNVNSSAGNIITLQSSTNGVQATFNKTAGKICIGFVTLQDLKATGGAAFYASTSTNNGNNSGWNFSSQSCLFILPVRLLSFDLLCNADNILFKWKTATEINSSHFEIQRQVNQDWITIGNTPATGESQSERNYQFQSTDQGGVYRLVSVDRDGNKSYSDIKPIQCGQRENITIVPNPVQRELELRIKSTKYERTNLQIINSLGQVVKNENVVIIPGINQFKLNVAALPAGKYILSIQSRTVKIHFLKI